MGIRLESSHYFSIPPGFIGLWSGSIASIPSGWALCNGSNGTPDLRDKFIVGAKQDDAGTAKTNLTGALTQSGGNANHTHTTSVDLAGGQDIADAGGIGSYFSQVNATSGSNSTQPPYYALAYIMKL